MIRSANRVLAIAWEDPDAPSARGTALARRIGQVVHGFARAGWTVDLLHRAPETGAAPIGDSDKAARIWRLPVPGPDIDPPQRMGTLSRKFSTAWHALRHGDRSGLWAREAIRALDRGRLPERPNLVVAFFTPRGPLEVARWIHEQWQVPWIADLQDPSVEGSGPASVLVRRWMRQTLQSAGRVVQVSPEWAGADARILRRSVDCLRHGIPSMLPDSEQRRDGRVSREGQPLVLVYAGSLDPSHQSAVPVIEAIGRLNRDVPAGGAPRVLLRVAGAERVYRYFVDALGDSGADAVRWLGWLDATALLEEMRRADCLVLIPWFRRERQGVPSKLFEYAATGRPILIAGPDSGALRRLLAECEHPDVVWQTPAEIEATLRRVLAGDASPLLDVGRCGKRPLGEADLVGRYLAWADAAVRPTLREADPVGELVRHAE